MGDHVVGHHPTMPGVRKTAQAVVATRRLEDSLHASMMTILPSLCKTMAWRVQVGRASLRDLLSMAPGLSPSVYDVEWTGAECGLQCHLLCGTAGG